MVYEELVFWLASPFGNWQYSTIPILRIARWSIQQQIIGQRSSFKFDRNLSTSPRILDELIIRADFSKVFIIPQPYKPTSENNIAHAIPFPENHHCLWIFQNHGHHRIVLNNNGRVKFRPHTLRPQCEPGFRIQWKEIIRRESLSLFSDFIFNSNQRGWKQFIVFRTTRRRRGDGDEIDI